MRFSGIDDTAQTGHSTLSSVGIAKQSVWLCQLWSHFLLQQKKQHKKVWAGWPHPGPGCVFTPSSPHVCPTCCQHSGMLTTQEIYFYIFIYIYIYIFIALKAANRKSVTGRNTSSQGWAVWRGGGYTGVWQTMVCTGCALQIGYNLNCLSFKTFSFVFNTYFITKTLYKDIILKRPLYADVILKQPLTCDCDSP